MIRAEASSMRCASYQTRSNTVSQLVLAALQVKAKYNATMAELFREAFCWLPLAHCLNGKVLVVHGGLFSRDGVKLDEIRTIDRCRCACLPTPAVPNPICAWWGPRNAGHCCVRAHQCSSFGPSPTSACMQQLCRCAATRRAVV